jgi:hypothetical protein
MSIRIKNIEEVILQLKPLLRKYLEENNTHFKGSLFTCPNHKFHNNGDSTPSAGFVPGTDEQIFNCFSCFPGDSLVDTPQGQTPIKDLKIGDLVKTQDGSYQKILQTFERDYEESLLELRTGTPESLVCTPEHPILTLNFKQSKNQYFRDYTPFWKEAKNFKRGDLILCPVTHKKEDEKYLIFKNSQGQEQRVLLNKRVLLLLGFFLAEGCATHYLT